MMVEAGVGITGESERTTRDFFRLLMTDARESLGYFDFACLIGKFNINVMGNSN